MALVCSMGSALNWSNVKFHSVSGSRFLSFYNAGQLDCFSFAHTPLLLFWGTLGDGCLVDDDFLVGVVATDKPV